MLKDRKGYRILVIEDNDGDFVIVEDHLSDRVLSPSVTRALTFREAKDILSVAVTSFDVILLDLSLPDKRGQQLVTEMLNIAASSPVIILTGYSDVAFSIRSISLGISDYLLKEDLNAAMLYKSIIYAIERQEAFSELKRSEKRYHDLFHLSPQPMWVFDSGTFRFTQVNKAAIALYGYGEEEFLNMTLMDIKLKEDIPAAIAELAKEDFHDQIFQATIKHRKKSGEIIDVAIYSTPIKILGKNLRSVIAIDVTEKNQYENKITRAIIKTQEDERYEIGGELHDNVCQLLAVSQLTFGMLGDSIIPSRTVLYGQGLGYITMALNEIRNISHRLAPAFFDESTLEEAFYKLFETFGVDQTFEILLHFDDAVKKYPITLELQLNLYRILQEQLRNIQKYARARLVEVDLLIHNNRLKMKISDDGVGFDITTVKEGIGLANMKRRAELFSGRFQIESSPGNGCLIVIDIPLSEIKLLDTKVGIGELMPAIKDPNSQLYEKY